MIAVLCILVNRRVRSASPCTRYGSTLSSNTRAVACFDGAYDDFDIACMASPVTDISLFVPVRAGSWHMETVLCWCAHVCCWERGHGGLVASLSVGCDRLLSVA